MNNNNYTGEPEVKDKGHFGWGILGFFFPLVGLILFLAWRSDKPGDSKCAGIGALASVICRVLVSAAFYFAIWPMVQKTLVQQTCNTYGPDYVAERNGSNWRCRNTVTNKYIDVVTDEDEPNKDEPVVTPTQKVESLTFRQALANEELVLKNENYKETEDQVVVYLFMGHNCPHCKDFLEFMNNINADYGKYYRLVVYETWYNDANNQLLNDVSKFLNKEAQGVPYIIIGKQVFEGYDESFNENIKKAIKDLYNTEKSKRYDALEDYYDSKEEENLD